MIKMSSVLILISRRIFERSTKIKNAELLKKHRGKAAKIGDLWEMDRFYNAHRRLRTQEELPTFYLVVVRPNHRLWLVAILRNVHFGKSRSIWIGDENRVPITDITSLIGSLEFETGQGKNLYLEQLSAKLKTPRFLTKSDVRLIHSLCDLSVKTTENKTFPSFFARTLVKEQAETVVFQSLDLVAEDVEKQAVRTMKMFKNVAKQIGQSRLAIHVLDWGAEILRENSKTKNGKILFKTARIQERKLKEKSIFISEIADQFARYRRFAAAKMVDQNTMIAFIRDLIKLKAVDQADALLELLIFWSSSAEALQNQNKQGQTMLLNSAMFNARIGIPTIKLLNAVKKFGLVAKQPELEKTFLKKVIGIVQIAQNEVWIEYKDVLSREIREKKSFQDWAADLFPYTFGGSSGWRAILLESETIKQVASRKPVSVLRWLERALNWIRLTEEDIEEWFEKVVFILAPTMKNTKLPLKLAMDMDIGLVDILLEHQIPVSEEKEIIFNFWNWSQRPKRRSLSFLAAHPIYRPRLLPSYDRSNHMGLDSILHKAVIDSAAKEPIFSAKIASFQKISTIAEFLEQQKALENFLSPENLLAFPALRSFLNDLDVSSMLTQTFQIGIMDEFCWPEQDKANDSLDGDINQYNTDGPFPYWVMLNKEDGTLLIIGPDGEELRTSIPKNFAKNVRSMRYVQKDVFFFTLQSALRVGQWLSNIEHSFKTEMYSNWTIGVKTPENGIWEGACTWHAGMEKIENRHFSPLFSDGERFWTGRQQINPDTGKALSKRDPLPIWLSEFEEDGTLLDLSACMYWPIPKQISNSPLGGLNGQSGIRVRQQTKTKIWELETIDGRSWKGTLPNIIPKALFRFPHRDQDCLYARLKNGFDHGIWQADGTLVVPAQHGNFFTFWNGAPQWLPLMWWHYLVPRDPIGSKALAKCTRRQANLLIKAAHEGKPTSKTEVLASNGKITGTITKNTSTSRSALDELPALAEALDDVFPTITHKRLRSGMAKIVERARVCDELVKQWRNAATQKIQLPINGLIDNDIPTTFFEPGWRYGERKLEASFRWSDEFIAKTIAPDMQTEHARLAIFPLPHSQIRWEFLLVEVGGLARLILSPAVPEKDKKIFSKTLDLWRQTDFGQNGTKYRLFGVKMKTPPPNIVFDTGTLGVQNSKRYVLRTTMWQNDNYCFNVIEKADQNGVFSDPDWATITWMNHGRNFWNEADQMEKAIQMSLANQNIPWDPLIGKQISQETGLLPESAALIWLGAVGPFFPNAKLRKRLRMTKAMATLATKELPKNYRHFYARSMPENIDSLFTPLKKDKTGISSVDRFIKIWIEMFGKRTLLDASLVFQLENDFKTTKEEFHLDLRVFNAPEKFNFLTSDEKWVIRPWKGFQSSVSYMRGMVPQGRPKHVTQMNNQESPDINKAFSGWVLKQFLRYVPWAHQSLPIGHSVRIGLAKMCKLIEKRLQNPDLLLLAGAVDLSEETDPKALSEKFEDIFSRFEGKPYVIDDGETAEGLDDGELVISWPNDCKNSFFLSFRPNQVQDPARLAKLAQDLSIYRAFEETGGGCTCGLNFGNRQAVDITELPAWLIWQSEGFQQIVDRLDAIDLPKGVYEADPRVSAPDIFRKVRKSLSLSENAATLYLQILTLAEPTEKRLKHINNWNKKHYTLARKELLTRKLLVEKTYNGTKRTLFVPEEVVFPHGSVATIEASKQNFYGIKQDAEFCLRAFFSVALPVRPFSQLFTESFRFHHLRESLND